MAHEHIGTIQIDDTSFMFWNDGGVYDINGVKSHVDAIMLEEQYGNLEVPSAYALPSAIMAGWDSQVDETEGTEPLMERLEIAIKRVDNFILHKLEVK